MQPIKGACRPNFSCSVGPCSIVSFSESDEAQWSEFGGHKPTAETALCCVLPDGFHLREIGAFGVEMRSKLPEVSPLSRAESRRSGRLKIEAGEIALSLAPTLPPEAGESSVVLALRVTSAIMRRVKLKKARINPEGL